MLHAIMLHTIMLHACACRAGTAVPFWQAWAAMCDQEAFTPLSTEVPPHPSQVPALTRPHPHTGAIPPTEVRLLPPDLAPLTQHAAYSVLASQHITGQHGAAWSIIGG